MNELERAGRGTRGYGSTGVNVVSDTSQANQKSMTKTQVNEDTQKGMQCINNSTPKNNKDQSWIEKARQIISACQIQKLATQDHPIFLAVVRMNELPSRIKKRSQNCVAKYAAPRGIIKGQKGQINKQTSPKKDFATIEER